MVAQTDVPVNTVGEIFVEGRREFEILPECQFPRFSKIPLKGGREKRRNGAQPQNEILRKGVWGTAPTSRNCGFRQRREPQFRAFVGTKTLLAK